VNEAFTPSADARRAATAIVEAFARQPEKGAIAIGGRLFEKPHLLAAERVLSRAAGAASATSIAA
jgi:citrate lyase subunit beta/citryl-CoA lyase